MTVKTNGLECLGTLIGSGEFVKNSCLQQVKTGKSLLSKLPYLQDAQTASLILRYCGVPKILHLLRTVAPKLTNTTVNEHDNAIRLTFENIISCNLSDRNYQQQLSLKHGGFGLITATEKTSSAFLGAWANTLTNLPSRGTKEERLCTYFSANLESEITPTGSDLREELQVLHQNGDGREEDTSTFKPSSQCPKETTVKITLNHQRQKFEQFLQTCQDEKEKARILSCGGPTAGMWLDAIPSKQHFTMTTADFCTAALT